MIKLICVGKIKEKYLSELILDYSKRINKYHKFNIIEVKDNNIEDEGKEIVRNIGKNGFHKNVPEGTCGRFRDGMHEPYTVRPYQGKNRPLWFRSSSDSEE